MNYSTIAAATLSQYQFGEGVLLASHDAWEEALRSDEESMQLTTFVYLKAEPGSVAQNDLSTHVNPCGEGDFTPGLNVETGLYKLPFFVIVGVDGEVQAAQATVRAGVRDDRGCIYFEGGFGYRGDAPKPQRASHNRARRNGALQEVAMSEPGVKSQCESLLLADRWAKVVDFGSPMTAWTPTVRSMATKRRRKHC